MYDFDEIIPRKGTGCVKWDVPVKLCGRDDLLPLWVADMDFATPDFVVDAIRRRLEHPVFGYTFIPDNYFEVIAGWVGRLHGWKVDPGHMRYIPGIVKGIGLALNALLKPGEKVVIQPPVYHPFRLVPEHNGIEVLYNPLRARYTAEGFLDGYDMDFNDLENVLSDSAARVLILSNPHNPAGICWDRETLLKLAEVTSRHNVIVISDEIHCEMVLPCGKEWPKHIPYASVSPVAAANSITFMAPSKTFNLAGIVSSYAIVSDEALREKFFGFLDANELSSPDIFAPIATLAAYTEGETWRREMLEYVRANAEYVCGRINCGTPLVHALMPQASFLLWLDCRRLRGELDPGTSLADFFQNAGLFLVDGSVFSRKLPDGTQGPEGAGYMRMNLASPRSVLKMAVDALLNAVKTI